MEQIQELSLGVVGEYREQKKGKLQRTFVSCSDAANKKVNRLKGSESCSKSDVDKC